jgi:phosphoglycolate phosphatase-like HAD superfamily hydrolase
MSDPHAELKLFKPMHDFFVGIDSDGAVYDTMEIKHKECFCPNTIEWWGLQAVSKYAREAFEFVNLYSKWRGINRWPAVKMVFDLLRERPEVLKRGTRIPEGKAIQAFIDSGIITSNEGLREFIGKHATPETIGELLTAWKWTHAVNDTIAHMVHDVPPFPYVRESLRKLQPVADMVCVSATPVDALRREWEEHDVAQYVALILGQEQGTKAQHLQIAAKGRYPSSHILMIGDAPGDMKAARANDALFFPINPGHEDASWQRFFEEACDKFLAGTYAGAYEAALVQEFESYLPSTPPWKR